jgi:hypothetical protein
MSKQELHPNMDFFITTNPHRPDEPSLHIKGVDTAEQVDTYSVDEVEDLIERLHLVLGEMLHKQRIMELNKTPTLWDKFGE